jgi:hypothetical protein
MRGPKLLETAQAILDVGTPDTLAQPEGWRQSQSHRRNDPDRAERDAQCPDQLAIVVAPKGNGSAGPGYQPPTDELGGKVRQAHAGAMSARGDGAGNRLVVDVAEVGKGHTELGQCLARLVECHSGADGRLARRLIDPFDAPEIRHGDEAITCFDQPR